MKAVVVVESPAKAKTISKYLGAGYHVVASYGHIRDLPVKDGSVRPDENFSMDWAVDTRAEHHFQNIVRVIHGANQLYLATDPDREGEAIAWHVREELTRRAILSDIDVKRITFHEITRDAVQNALHYARDLNDELVEAYLARRALDYLVGFTLSPVLWRKLPGSRSAGRVQSVALRLICEREIEVERFIAREYWTVEADFLTTVPFTAYLTHLDNSRLDKFALPDEKTAAEARTRVEAATFTIRTVSRTKKERRPPPPFTTSTMQQEAARALHFAARRTMYIAQRLYEGVDVGGESVGLITYMRTDSVQITATVVKAIQDLISCMFGTGYRPMTPHTYKTEVKNAQEAHEAIRPTDIHRHPQMLATCLDHDQLQLYELIWKRTVASQMRNAELNKVAVDVISTDQTIILRATGSVVTFDGFLCLYREGHDDEEEKNDSSCFPSLQAAWDNDKLLPPITVGDGIHRSAVRSTQHFTKAQPRYSEASLVKKLEELGIGRPSTYATILAVLQNRDYVRMVDRRFIPEDRGRVVTAFLENYFNHYIQYTFTATLEDQLDAISDGRVGWKMVLRQFWDDFIRHVEDAKSLRVSEVLGRLDRELGAHFFPHEGVRNNDPRQCPTCTDGRLALKLGRFGAFIGCSHYPDCCYTRPLSILISNSQEEHKNSDNVRVLGLHPETGARISLRKGPYGFYVQLDPINEVPAAASILEARGNNTSINSITKRQSKGKGARKLREDSVLKPKRVPIPKGLSPAIVTLETAMQLLGLPREIGLHPQSGKPITASLSRFGPYLRHGNIYKSLPTGEDLLTIDVNRAVALLATVRPLVQTLGIHPADGKPVLLKVGRYGPYIEHGKVRVALPGDPCCTFEAAVARLAAKAETKKQS
ncbi:DNA topoisomerase I [invertebrate metagenome]|uniref:DNA topoisomerase n=1 Tax=invertebrate metagenome TaxID=1711999 RepID=A0A484H6L4_9ZZZZ